MNQLFTNRTINTLNFRIGDELFSFNIKTLLVINENQLESEATSAPAMFGYLSVIKSKLSRKVSDLELEIKTLFSDIYLEAKEDPTQSRVTDAQAEAIAYSDKGLIELSESLNEAKEQLNLVWGLVEAFKLKVNLIQTISANMRSV